jgi:hypothetical protein
MHCRLANCSTALNDLLSPPGVHVLCQPTDIAGVGLCGTVKLVERLALHRQSNTVQHEPGSLLRDAKCPPQFVATDPIAAVGDAPHGHKPLVQAKRRILKDRPDLMGELFAALSTPQQVASLDFADPIRSALGARNPALGPLDVPHVFVAHVKVSEVANGRKQGLRFHDSSFGVYRLAILASLPDYFAKRIIALLTETDCLPRRSVTAHRSGPLAFPLRYQVFFALHSPRSFSENWPSFRVNQLLDIIPRHRACRKVHAETNLASQADSVTGYVNQAFSRHRKTKNLALAIGRQPTMPVKQSGQLERRCNRVSAWLGGNVDGPIRDRVKFDGSCFHRLTLTFRLYSTLIGPVCQVPSTDFDRISKISAKVGCVRYIT